MFISTQDLAKIYKDDSVLIIDARSYKDYSKSHIPGAVSLDLFSFHWADTSEKGLISFGEHMRKFSHMQELMKIRKLFFMMMYLECLQQEVYGCVCIFHIQMFKC